MKLPFVSRDRLEEVERRLAASEEERRLLTDRLALLRGEPPIFARIEVARVEVPAPVVVREVPVDVEDVKKAKEPTPKNAAGSVTFDHVLAQAAAGHRPPHTRTS